VAVAEVIDQAMVEYSSLLDDRGLIAPGDPSVLIVEDDERFAKVVVEFAREKNFKAIVTHQGDSALSLARDYLPSAIMLDLDLPDIDGFTVLDRLKRDPSTRHIPVHVMSSLRERERALRQGAISYINKPVGAKRCRKNSPASRSSCWAANARCWWWTTTRPSATRSLP
jgi:CheY-like chemotaxis protein